MDNNEEIARLMAAIANRDAGTRWPAFGKYRCSQCNHEWVSWGAWRATGQACLICFNIERPYELHKIRHFYFYCKRCKDYSRNTNEFPRFCPVCGDQVALSRGPPLIRFEQADIPDPQPAAEDQPPVVDPHHKMELCEKCLNLNRGRISGREPCLKTSYWNGQLAGPANAPAAVADY